MNSLQDFVDDLVSWLSTRPGVTEAARVGVHPNHPGSAEFDPDPGEAIVGFLLDDVPVSVEVNYTP